MGKKSDDRPLRERIKDRKPVERKEEVATISGTGFGPEARQEAEDNAAKAAESVTPDPE